MTDVRRRAIFHGLGVGGLIFCAYLFAIVAPAHGFFGYDAWSYWTLDLGAPYRGSVGDLGFFPYSPAAALALSPLTAVSWPVFVIIWWSLLIGALVWIGRRDFLVLLAFPPVAIELYHGNIHLLLAAALVASFRYPALWAFVVLTKVTPGIGLLWFVARREWRQLATALLVTGAIAGISFLLMPSQWAQWIAAIDVSAANPPVWPALGIPLWVRLPFAAAIVWWGATRSARWSVPVAATLALPALWIAGLSMLVACWPLRSSSPAERADSAADHGSARRWLRKAPVLSSPDSRASAGRRDRL